MNQIAKFIKENRKAAGLTQEEFALRSGLGLRFVRMSEYRTARIFVRDKLAGLLRETDEGYSFAYDTDYLSSEKPSPVSLTLPLTEKPYISKTLFAFFDGLIPEGWLLDVVVHNWKLNEKDRFGILLAACKDPIGNVSVREVSE